MRVLVTGGAGFIGSHVVDRLRAAGIEPRIIDLKPSPHHSPSDVDQLIGDLLDPHALTDAMRDCHAVVHLAADADAESVARYPARAEEVNSRGTLNVLQAARATSVRRVVYGSTIWVYSDARAAFADEESLLGLPCHLYTATKLAGEMYCRSYAELYGLEYTILRFGIPYGPRARPEAVVSVFVRKALAGEPLTIAGDGRQSRRFIYVDDLAEGVVRALAPVAANRIYNLVGEEDVTIRDVAEAVRSAVGDVAIVNGPGRTGDFAGVKVSSARAARELGWRTSTPFAAGLPRYVAWHCEQTADGRDGELAAAQTPAEADRENAALLQGLPRPGAAAAVAALVALIAVLWARAGLPLPGHGFDLVSPGMLGAAAAGAAGGGVARRLLRGGVRERLDTRG